MVGVMTSTTNSRLWISNYLIVALIWGFSFYFIEVLLLSFHPAVIVLLRLAIGSITLLTITRVMKLKLPFDIWKKLFFMAILMNSLPGFLIASAQDHISSILAGIINATTPLVTLVFLLLVFKEQKVSNYQIVGLLIGFSGVVVVLGVWTGIPSGQLVALLAVLIAVIGYAFAIPYYRKNIMPYDYPPTAILALQISISALQIAPVAAFNLQLRGEISAKTILAAVMLGSLSSGIAYVLHYKVTAEAGAAIASSVTYLTPVVAAVAGILLLNEELRWYEFAGAAIIIIGIIISRKEKSEK
jgi:drug/metabolite transporter (DMT)-like permease